MIELLTREKIKGKFQRGPRDRFAFPLDALKPMIPPDSPEEFVKLTYKCISDEKQNRPAFEDIVNVFTRLEGKLADQEKKAASNLNTSTTQTSATQNVEIPDLNNFRPRSQTSLSVLYAGEQINFEFDDAFTSESQDEKQQKLIITGFRVALLKGKEILESVPLSVILKIEKIKSTKKGFKAIGNFFFLFFLLFC